MGSALKLQFLRLCVKRVVGYIGEFMVFSALEIKHLCAKTSDHVSVICSYFVPSGEEAKMVSA